jgi:hypothetical protein
MGFKIVLIRFSAKSQSRSRASSECVSCRVFRALVSTQDGSPNSAQKSTRHDCLSRHVSIVAFSRMQPGTPATLGSCGCVINPDKRSRATVKLNSTNVRDPPSVDTNLLAQQEEVDRMVMCIEKERLYWEELRGLRFNITEILPGEGLDLQAAVRLPCCTPIPRPHLMPETSRRATATTGTAT